MSQKRRGDASPFLQQRVREVSDVLSTVFGSIFPTVAPPVHAIRRQPHAALSSPRQYRRNPLSAKQGGHSPEPPSRQPRRTVSRGNMEGWGHTHLRLSLILSHLQRCARWSGRRHCLPVGATRRLSAGGDDSKAGAGGNTRRRPRVAIVENNAAGHRLPTKCDLRVQRWELAPLFRCCFLLALES
jgi:hypothetical protein